MSLFSFLEIKFQNGAHLKKGYFDLLFTFFSHQGKVTKIPSAHISLTYIHMYFAHPIDFFALPILKKKKKKKKKNPEFVRYGFSLV